MRKSIFCIVVLLISVLCPAPAWAEKLGTLVNGCVYLSDGDSVVADNGRCIAMPSKKKKLVIVENAHSAEQKVAERIAPSLIDSVRVWKSTAPGRPHSLHFLAGHGWAWLLENNSFLRVYAFSPKGYFISGKGGMWPIDKSVLIVVKDGQEHEFGRPDKQADDSFRAKVAALAEGDEALAEQILASRYRRDKTLRMLKMYKQ